MTEPANSGAFFSRDAMSSVPWLLVGKLLTFFLYFVISIFIVRGLGPTNYGIYSLLSSIADYFMVICAMGLNTALLRFVPELIRDKNRPGLKRFLRNSLFLQLAALTGLGLTAYIFSSSLGELFHIPFSIYIAALLFFTGMLLTKEYLNNLFTALFMARFLAITSVGQALLFLGWLLWLGHTDSYGVNAVLIAYSSSIAAMAVISLIKLKRYLSVWEANTSLPGIGRGRVLRLTLPMMFNAMTNKLLQQYSEIFFLGYFVTPAMVGYYSLGFTLANLLLNFVPMALHTLFTSAFAEAYTRNKESIADLTKGVYQVLILVTVPLACFGFFFSPATVVVVYGKDMAPAGPIASFFSLFQLLPMIWIPLSMAITAVEKVGETMWLNAVQLVVNLILDYFLIKYFFLVGAMAAKALTFVITLPLKIIVIRRLVGGIYLPISFLARIFVTAFALAGMLYYIWPRPNLLGLFGLAFLYALIGIIVVKIFKIIRPADIERFRTIDIKPLNKAFDFLTGVK
ncbi:MAG: oligosaccharide flippase family protein [Chlamydiales bacterium]|nr:oligosaccharide flippase family protein [Chlamydiales bacterium]